MEPDHHSNYLSGRDCLKQIIDIMQYNSKEACAVAVKDFSVKHTTLLVDILCLNLIAAVQGGLTLLLMIILRSMVYG